MIKDYIKQNLRTVYDVVRSVHHGAKESRWRKNYEEQSKACHVGRVSANHQISKIYIEPSESRLNLIFNEFTKGTIEARKTFLADATKYAIAKHYALRIISRNTIPNPKDYQDFLRSYNLELPDSISFYTDCKDRVSMPTYRLETTKGDIFFTEDEAVILKEFIKNEK